MNLYLIGAILFLALIKSDTDKKLMFASMAVFQGGHYLVASQLSAEMWWAYDATGALLLFALSQVFTFDEDRAIYQLILLVGILSNLIDYVFWFNNLPQDPSSLIFLGLYSYAIIILISGAAYGHGNDGALRFFNWICEFIDKNNLGCLAKAKRSQS